MRCPSSMRLESTTKRSPNRHWQATIYQVFSKKVEERLQEEEDRVNAYLNPRTREALISECRGLLIREHPDEMWESSQSLRAVEDLQRMFPLLYHFLLSGGTYAYLPMLPSYNCLCNPLFMSRYVYAMTPRFAFRLTLARVGCMIDHPGRSPGDSNSHHWSQTSERSRTHQALSFVCVI